MYLIFHYLSKNIKKRLVMDPHYPHIDEKAFNITANWVDFYRDIKEEDPPNMPEPLGAPVDSTAVEDSDHAGNVITHQSHTVILIFVNNALI